MTDQHAPASQPDQLEERTYQLRPDDFVRVVAVQEDSGLDHAGASQVRRPLGTVRKLDEYGVWLRCTPNVNQSTRDDPLARFVAGTVCCFPVPDGLEQGQLLLSARGNVVEILLKEDLPAARLDGFFRRPGPEHDDEFRDEFRRLREEERRAGSIDRPARRVAEAMGIAAAPGESDSPFADGDHWGLEKARLRLESMQLAVGLAHYVQRPDYDPLELGPRIYEFVSTGVHPSRPASPSDETTPLYQFRGPELDDLERTLDALPTGAFTAEGAAAAIIRAKMYIAEARRNRDGPHLRSTREEPGHAENVRLYQVSEVALEEIGNILRLVANGEQASGDAARRALGFLEAAYLQANPTVRMPGKGARGSLQGTKPGECQQRQRQGGDDGGQG